MPLVFILLISALPDDTFRFIGSQKQKQKQKKKKRKETNIEEAGV